MSGLDGNYVVEFSARGSFADLIAQAIAAKEALKDLDGAYKDASKSAAQADKQGKSNERTLNNQAIASDKATKASRGQVNALKESLAAAKANRDVIKESFNDQKALGRIQGKNYKDNRAAALDQLRELRNLQARYKRAFKNGIIPESAFVTALNGLGRIRRDLLAQAGGVEGLGDQYVSYADKMSKASARAVAAASAERKEQEASAKAALSAKKATASAQKATADAAADTKKAVEESAEAEKKAASSSYTMLRRRIAARKEESALIGRGFKSKGSLDDLVGRTSYNPITEAKRVRDELNEVYSEVDASFQAEDIDLDQYKILRATLKRIAQDLEAQAGGEESWNKQVIKNNKTQADLAKEQIELAKEQNAAEREEAEALRKKLDLNIELFEQRKKILDLVKKTRNLDYLKALPDSGTGNSKITQQAREHIRQAEQQDASVKKITAAYKRLWEIESAGQSRLIRGNEAYLSQLEKIDEAVGGLTDSERLRYSTSQTERKATVSPPLASLGDGGRGNKDHASISALFGGGSNIISRFVKRFSKMKVVLKGLAVAAVLSSLQSLITAVFAAGGAVVVFSQALAQLGGVLGAVPGGIFALGAAAGSVILAFKGMGNAFSLFAKELNGEGPKTYAEALAEMSPSARKVTESLTGMYGRFKEIKKATQEAVFAPIAGEIGKLNHMLPVFEGLMTTVGSAVGKVGAKFIKTFTTKQWQDNFKLLGKSSAKVVGSLGDGLISLVSAFGKIAVAARPLTEFVGKTLAGLSKDFERWTGSLTGGSFATAQTRLTQFISIFKSLGSVVASTFRAAAPVTDWFMRRFDEVAKGWANTAKRSTGLKKFFQDLKPVMSATSKLFGDLFRGLAQRVDMKGFVGIVDLMRTELLPAIFAVVDAFGTTEQLARFISLLSSIVTIASNLFGPLLQGFSSVMQVMLPLLRVMARISEIPVLGQLLGVAGVIVGVKILAARLGIIFGLMQKIPGVGGLIAGAWAKITGQINASTASMARFAAAQRGAAGASGLAGIAASNKSAAIGTAKFLALAAAAGVMNAALTTDVNDQALAKNLDEFAKSGAVAGEVAQVFGDDMSKLKSNLSFMLTPNWYDGVVKAAGQITSALGMFSTEGDIGQQITKVDQALVGLANSDLEAAAAAFDRIKQAANDAGIPIEELTTLFPQYTAAAGAMDVATVSSLKSVGDAAASAGDNMDWTKFGDGLPELTSVLQKYGVTVEQFGTDTMVRGRVAAESYFESIVANKTKVKEAKQQVSEMDKAFVKLYKNLSAGEFKNTDLTKLVDGAPVATKFGSAISDVASKIFEYRRSLEATGASAGLIDGRVSMMTQKLIAQIPWTEANADALSHLNQSLRIIPQALEDINGKLLPDTLLPDVSSQIAQYGTLDATLASLVMGNATLLKDQLVQLSNSLSPDKFNQFISSSPAMLSQLATLGLGVNAFSGAIEAIPGFKTTKLTVDQAKARADLMAFDALVLKVKGEQVTIRINTANQLPVMESLLKIKGAKEDIGKGTVSIPFKDSTQAQALVDRLNKIKDGIATISGGTVTVDVDASSATGAEATVTEAKDATEQANNTEAILKIDAPNATTTRDAVQEAHQAVLNANGAEAVMTVRTEIASNAGGLIGAIRKNMGGLIQGLNVGGKVLHAAKGAFVPGPRGVDKDVVPAMLTPGEYVLRKSAVQKLGLPLLEALNRSGERSDVTIPIDQSSERFGLQFFGRGGKAKKSKALKRVEKKNKIFDKFNKKESRVSAIRQIQDYDINRSKYGLYKNAAAAEMGTATESYNAVMRNPRATAADRAAALAEVNRARISAASVDRNYADDLTNRNAASRQLAADMKSDALDKQEAKLNKKFKSKKSKESPAYKKAMKKIEAKRTLSQARAQLASNQSNRELAKRDIAYRLSTAAQERQIADAAITSAQQSAIDLGFDVSATPAQRAAAAQALAEARQARADLDTSQARDREDAARYGIDVNSVAQGATGAPDGAIVPSPVAAPNLASLDGGTAQAPSASVVGASGTTKSYSFGSIVVNNPAPERGSDSIYKVIQQRTSREP